MVDCVIFAGSELNVSSFDEDKYKDSYIICADRGVAHVMSLGIEPDLIVGDFDSLGYVPDADCQIIRFVPEKDDTDLMIAIKEAVKREKKEIDIYGALGGRLDHTFGNIQALSFACEKGVKAQLISDCESVCILPVGEYKFEKKDGFSLSLFSYTPKVEGLTIQGTKYTLNNGCIDNSFPIGISNEITENNAKVCFKSGKLVVIRSKL